MMPYADNSGLRIHYHVEGEGPLLVLHHGLSADLESWRNRGYVGSLKCDYQLILMDARGHGASDKPHEPEAYAMEHQVSDVVAVLDHLDLGSAHFFGYSMGGKIGFGFAKLAPEKAKSLTIEVPPRGA
jgi:pimeloyl-ACP methyl ester carboxylesterase